MNDTELASFKIKLLARKEELLELEKSTINTDKNAQAANQDLMSSIEPDHRCQQELAQIEGALRRLASEDYGFCFKCDEEIELHKLSATPTLTRCAACTTK